MGKRISTMKSPRRIAGAALALVCFVLWVVYLTGDFGRLFPTNAPKFSLVSLTCAFAVLSFVLDVVKPEKDRFLPDLLLVFALAFTLISDVFLLLIDDYYVLGVSTFIVAQLCHFFRLYLLAAKNRFSLFVSLGLRVGLGLAAGCLFGAYQGFDALYLLVGVYFVNLLANCGESLVFLTKGQGNGKTMLLLFLGFLLFIGCDVFVGLRFIGKGMPSLIWFFYGPSQVLLALSSIPGKKNG